MQRKDEGRQVTFFALDVLFCASALLPQGSDQTSRFELFLNGRPAGWETFRVYQEKGETVFSGQSVLGEGLKIEYFEVAYSSAHPVRALLKAQIRGTHQEVETRFEGSEAKSQIRIGKEKSERTDKVSDRPVVLVGGTIPLFLFEALVRRLLASGNSAVDLQAYVLCQVEIPVHVSLAGPEEISLAGKSLRARCVDAILTNPGDRRVDVKFWLDAENRVLKISIPGASLDAYREGFSPAAKEAAESHGEVDVKFPSGEIRLAGTLTLPAQGKKPFPGVVMISGSGPTDRDGTVRGVPIFAQITQRLAAEGIAVLRYDDRGVGQSGGDFSTAGMRELEGDARAALDFLRQRSELDPNRILVLGHSEGGTICTRILSPSNRVAGVVLMACPATNGRALILEQLEHVLTPERGVSAELRQRRLALQQRIFEAAGSGEGWDTLGSELSLTDLALAKSRWFAEFIETDPLPGLRSFSGPVLILQGEKDTQVFPRHAEELARAVEPGRAASVTLKVMPGLNHLFQKAATGDWDEYDRLPKRVAPEVLEELAGWFRAMSNP